MQEFRPFPMYSPSLTVGAVYPQSTLSKNGFHNVNVKYANTKRHSVTILFNTLSQVCTVFGYQIMSVCWASNRTSVGELKMKRHSFPVSTSDEHTEQTGYEVPLLNNSTIRNIEYFMNIWCAHMIAKSAYWVHHVRPCIRMCQSSSH
jgi:hypothetical protein